MTDQNFLPLPSLSDVGDHPKRKRTPSQHAAYIYDFKNVTTLLSRTSLPKEIKHFKAYSLFLTLEKLPLYAMPIV